MRKHSFSYPVLELCEDDAWFTFIDERLAPPTILPSTQPPATPQPPTPPAPLSFQLHSTTRELSLSWGEPLVGVEDASYSIECTATIQSRYRQTTPLTLSFSATNGMETMIPLLSLRKSANYTCCVRTKYELLGTASTPICKSILSSIPAAVISLPSMPLSESNLVLLLSGVACGFFVVMQVQTCIVVLLVCKYKRKVRKCSKVGK
jgi:hypothetical protein